MSTIVITTRPPLAGAAIVLDGEPSGVATDGNGEAVIERVPTGRHLIEVRTARGSGARALVVSAGMDEFVEIPIRFFRQTPVRADSSSRTSRSQSDFLAVISLSAIAVILLLASAGVGVLLFLLLRAQVPEAADGISRNLGRYQIEQTLATGGMATVFRAHEKGSGEAIALKVMHKALLDDPDLTKKFIREGEILSDLRRQDPDAPVVEVKAFGTITDRDRCERPFIAMELIEGDNLLQVLEKEGRLSVGRAAHYCAGVCRALVPAHRMGIYHRDLDPQNVLVAADVRGRFTVRLIDFGVARHEHALQATMDGTIAGKPPYMSPEQCRGLRVDGRSDIYSVGILFFALLTGSPPFRSRNPLEVMRMHETEEPAIPPDLPYEVQELLFRLLAKNPDDRIQSIEAVLEMLLAIAEARRDEWRAA